MPVRFELTLDSENCAARAAFMETARLGAPAHTARTHVPNEHSIGLFIIAYPLSEIGLFATDQVQNGVTIQRLTIKMRKNYGLCYYTAFSLRFNLSPTRPHRNPTTRSRHAICGTMSVIICCEGGPNDTLVNIHPSPEGDASRSNTAVPDVSLPDAFRAFNASAASVKTLVEAPAPFAIGDLQGCCNALQRLIEKIDADDRERIAAGTATGPSALWFVGDLVNRGPTSAATLRTLMAMGDRVTAVLGNHDMHLLAVAAGVRTQKKSDTIADILDAPDADAMIDWVRHRPLAHFADDILMVHAGVLPQWSAEQTVALGRELERGLQSDDWRSFIGRLFGSDATVWDDGLVGDVRLRTIANALTRLRFCTADGAMEWKANGGLESAPPGYMPWFDTPNRRTANVTVVFGHWAALGLIKRERLHGIDSGCVWGNALSAVRLAVAPEARDVLQVSCATR